MTLLGYFQILGALAGLGLIFYAGRYRTADFPSIRRRNPFAIIRLGEHRKHFTGPGFTIHRYGVWILTLSLVSGAMYLVGRCVAG